MTPMTRGPRLLGVASATIWAPTTSLRVCLMDVRVGCVCGRGVHCVMNHQTLSDCTS